MDKEENILFNSKVSTQKPSPIHVSLHLIFTNFVQGERKSTNFEKKISHIYIIGNMHFYFFIVVKKVLRRALGLTVQEKFYMISITCNIDCH